MCTVFLFFMPGNIYLCFCRQEMALSTKSHHTPFGSQLLAVTDTYMQNAVVQYHNWPNAAQPFHYSLIFSVHMHSDLHRDIHFSKHNVKTPEVSKLL